MFELARLLKCLVDHRVELIVVGGVAAALQGAPITTQDLDILYKLDDQNIVRLKRVLSELHAVSRSDPRKLPFDESHLRTTGHKLATTDAGPLDLLGSVNEDLRFEDLIDSSDTMEVSGHQINVLSLERLIELKLQLRRPKDVAMLPILEATLRARNEHTR